MSTSRGVPLGPVDPLPRARDPPLGPCTHTLVCTVMPNTSQLKLIVVLFKLQSFSAHLPVCLIDHVWRGLL